MRFRVAAVVEVHCERFIEADSFEDAEEQAQSMAGDEWLTWAVGPELIDITGVYHDPEEPVDPGKLVNPKGKKHSKKKNKK